MKLQTIQQIVQGTALLAFAFGNTHSVALNKTLWAVNSLLSVVQDDSARTQLVAYTLRSAVPIYINPEDREITFIINLPIAT